MFIDLISNQYFLNVISFKAIRFLKKSYNSLYLKIVQRVSLSFEWNLQAERTILELLPFLH